jgi:hypothetical protein
MSVTGVLRPALMKDNVVFDMKNSIHRKWENCVSLLFCLANSSGCHDK